MSLRNLLATLGGYHRSGLFNLTPRSPLMDAISQELNNRAALMQIIDIECADRAKQLERIREIQPPIARVGNKKALAEILLQHDQSHLVYHALEQIAAPLSLLEEDDHEALNRLSALGEMDFQLRCKLGEQGLDFATAMEIFHVNGTFLSMPFGCYHQLPGAPTNPVEISLLLFAILNHGTSQ